MKKSLERFFNDNLKPARKGFRDNFPFLKRLDESTRIREKYPERIPIICEKWGNDDDVPDIDRKKYLVPNDLSIANFMYVIRKRLKKIIKMTMVFYIFLIAGSLHLDRKLYLVNI
jgi:GABA(A) receptor-associated protein